MILGLPLAQQAIEPTPAWLPWLVLAQTILMGVAAAIAWLWKAGRWSLAIDHSKEIADLRQDLEEQRQEMSRRFDHAGQEASKAANRAINAIEDVRKECVSKELFTAEITNVKQRTELLEKQRRER